MGFNKINSPWEHVNPFQAINYFNWFWWLFVVSGIPWKRYVVSEHIKFIVEITDNPHFIGRSIFRSVQQYSDPQELNNIDWWIGYIGSRNPYTGEIEINTSTMEIGYERFRQIYRSYGGTGNF